MAENKITNIPTHVGIIMDGNGRWAKKRLMPRSFGHNAGMNAMIEVVEKAKEMGIKYVTVYALSTENLARPKDELDGLYNLFRKYFMSNVNKIIAGGSAVRVIGDLSALPSDIRALIEEAHKASPKDGQFTFTIALNYGSRAEIAQAVNKAVKIAEERKQKGEDETFTEKDVSNLLYTQGIPDPDLIIRTGGEKRLSNFLMYQAAYAELYFTDVLFPDFTPQEFEKAIADFSGRNRRFGKV